MRFEEEPRVGRVRGRAAGTAWAKVQLWCVGWDQGRLGCSMAWPGVMSRWKWPLGWWGLDGTALGEQLWGVDSAQELMGLPCAGDGAGDAGIQPSLPG